MKLRLVEKQNLKETDYNYLNKEIQTTVYDAFDGTDFMISGVELMDDGRITFNVLAMGPDGEMEREAELYVPEINYLDAVREACENWMLDHGTPDSFYESDAVDEDKFFNVYKYWDSYQNISKYNSPDELKKFLDNVRTKNYDHSVVGSMDEKSYKVLLDYANSWQELIDNCGYESKLNDSEESEATQTEDIAKKEEYKKMVEPSFKVGKRIKK